MPAELQPILNIVLGFWCEFWWLILPPLLIIIFPLVWMYYIRQKYIKNIKWTTLSLTIPREILKTPKAMEQLFAGLHGIKSAGNWQEQHFQGKVQEWISFEISGINGSIYYFIRTPEKYKNLIQSLIYAQYPEIEITESEDYTRYFPPHLPNKDYDLWGTEYYLGKENCYPLRTYLYFEDIKEEKRIDPLANLFEWLSQLKDGEAIWIQLLIKPIGDDWKKEGDKIVNKLLGKSEPKKAGTFSQFWIDFFDNLLQAPIRPPVWSEEKSGDNKLPSKAQFLSPGEKEVVEAIEHKIAKIGFEGGIRAIYLAKTDIFSKINVSAIHAYFRQFNTQNLNELKPNKAITTVIDYYFKKRRENLRKMKVYRNYRKRRLTYKLSVFNIEELATLYHFPIKTVEAPTFERIESRKGAPPAYLPISE